MNVYSSPTGWTDFQNLTFDMCLYHFLYWRATAIETLDIYPTNDTHIVPGSRAQSGRRRPAERHSHRSVADVPGFRQVRSILPYTDPQVISSSARNNLVNVQTITNDDLTEQVDLERAIVHPWPSLRPLHDRRHIADGMIVTMSRAPNVYLCQVRNQRPE